MMRFRLWLAATLFAAIVIAIALGCGFGVNLDGIFADASSGEASIPIVAAAQVRSGDGFSCARRIDGTVSCWGYNGDSGRLGDGSRESRSTPVLVRDVADAVDLSAGASHACVVRKSGAVVCWGKNDTRQLGDGTSTSSKIPVSVLQVTDATKVAAGGNFTCALRQGGTVVCWGDNSQGQLGDGSTTSRGQPAAVQGLTDVTQITAQFDLACALVKSGDVYCWGDNDLGQAGTGLKPDDVLSPAKVTMLSGVLAVESGPTSNHTCAITATDVRCWGDGGDGRLGNASTSNSATPVVVIGLNDTVSITTGREFTCATRKSGGVTCWGNDRWHQLGVGDTSPPGSVSSPVPTMSLTNAKQIAAGYDHVCALLDAGKIACWGSNVDARLGRGSRLYSDVPLKAVTQGPVTAVGVGQSHACAIGAQGVSCWGDNGDYRLGRDDVPAHGTPFAVSGVTGATRIATGIDHTCGVAGAGNVLCWGYGQLGQLGQGSNQTSSSPVVFGAGPAADVGVGYRYSCALLQSGEVACSGIGDDGRLGSPSGNVNNPIRVLAQVTDPDGGTAMNFGGATKLAVGVHFACALQGTNMACWGKSDNGQCGTSTSPNPIPVSVTLPGPATEISAGGAHTCAILQDGSVVCFGNNGSGQLGESGPSGPKMRVPNLGGKTAKAIACGYDHTCALASDGSVMCWGAGQSGQIGNGLRSDVPVPTLVSNLTDVKAIAAGGSHTCAIVQDGTVFCWGDDSIGQLGDGTVVLSGVPANVVGY